MLSLYLNYSTQFKIINYITHLFSIWHGTVYSKTWIMIFYYIILIILSYLGIEVSQL